MSSGNITSTTNTFGDVPGTLSGSIGVPGPQGPTGAAGATGAQGPAGPGLPAGGLEGQIIVKNSDGIDYDTVWTDNAAVTLTATVRNETGATLTKGTVVYINGAAGNKPTVTKASAASESASSKTFAILSADIPNNQNGQCVTVGLLKGVDTSAFTAGANLWLSVTPGLITQTPPTSPDHSVFLGNAVRIHATQGEIEVRIQNGLELGELHDVLITTPTNGQVLKYDSVTSLWKNQTDLNSGVWGSITGTLSSQTDLQTALDLKAPLASPTFTGTPSLPTGTIGVTQTAGDNTTALATTAFVTASNPDASTTVKGHVELATDAEAQNGSSTTLGMSPSAVAYAKSSPSYFRLSALAAAGATSGTGSFAGAFASGYNSRSPTTAVGYGILSFNLAFHSRGSGANAITPLPWNKRFVAQLRFHPRTLGTDENTINRVLFGKASGTTTGELTLRGVGVRQIASGALELVVHNGTTFTAVTSSYTPANLSSTDLRIVSDGAGNVTLFNNDSQIATTSAGPSTAGSTNNVFLTVESENLATITGTNNTLYVAEISFEFAI